MTERARRTTEAISSAANGIFFASITNSHIFAVDKNPGQLEHAISLQMDVVDVFDCGRFQHRIDVAVSVRQSTEICKELAKS